MSAQLWEMNKAKAALEGVFLGAGKGLGLGPDAMVSHILPFPCLPMPDACRTATPSLSLSRMESGDDSGLILLSLGSIWFPDDDFS